MYIYILPLVCARGPFLMSLPVLALQAVCDFMRQIGTDKMSKFKHCRNYH